MRQLLRLFIPLWLALCLLGCGKPVPSSYPPTMVEAARLSEHEAARALPLLEALADSLPGHERHPDPPDYCFL